jgi:uncharacterized protein YdeI (YjbR/CyaY-like superfamily)
MNKIAPRRVRSNTKFMATRATNPEVDRYVQETPEWRKETERLRAIALGCGLTEELKWGKPCYTYEGSNVVIIQGFKAYCALLFCKGALLKDPKGILVKPGENTQSARQARFTNVTEISAKEAVLKAYIKEAIAAERAGLEVTYKQTSEFDVPEELQKKFAALPALKTAFSALTPGRQRAYLLHFSAAKQSATRESRIEKNIPQILAGKGLNEDWRTQRASGDGRKRQ